MNPKTAEVIAALAGVLNTLTDVAAEDVVYTISYFQATVLQGLAENGELTMTRVIEVAQRATRDATMEMQRQVLAEMPRGEA